RATLLTRMTGDAGVPGQHMAIVPVGRVGIDDLGASLSQSLAQFLSTATVYLYDARSADEFGLVKRALDGVLQFFGAFERVARLRKDQQTVIHESTVRRIVEQVTARHGALFSSTSLPFLPRDLYCGGPVWLERLTANESDEAFRIQARTPAESAALE